MTRIPASRVEAEAMDRADPLAHLRERFVLPEGVIYLDGHSLGPATRTALAGVGAAASEEWAEGLIRSWNAAGWIDLPLKVGAQIARLVGAQADEVVVADSVSVNLFKLAAAGLSLARSRTLIVEDDEFPTDQYVAEGLAGLTGVRLIRAAGGEGEAALLESGGVLIRSVVNYRSGAVLDMAALEAAAREGGGLIVWDLSHATGVIDVQLNAAGARMAAGCTYKFLNGGPGAPAFVYVARETAARASSPISGWMGHAAPFAFASAYAPREGAARFAAGTPGILSLSALAGALEAFEGVEVATLWTKARALGDLIVSRGAELGLGCASPGVGETRGGHVSLVHPEAHAIVQALIAGGVIGDFRAPDVMRFGVAPAYIRWADVWNAMDALADVLRTRAWDTPEFRVRAAVT
jgi:kynureninase